MTLTPFDIPAPNADDPSPRILKFAPARNAGPGALADGASSSLPPFATRRAAEADAEAKAHIQAMRERLNGKGRHRVVPDLSWRDDIRSAPLSHAIVGVLGFMVGTFGILALAEVVVRL
jgi:hypothetical protein